VLNGTYFPIELLIRDHEILEISSAQKNLKKPTEIWQLKGKGAAMKAENKHHI